ncbi:MAG: YaaA family protein [Bacteroidota bacterium]
MADFAILLASAEGKAPGGNPLAPDMFDYRTSNTFNYFSDLNPERRGIIKELQSVIQDSDERALEKLFGVKGATLEEAVRVNLDVFGSPLLAAVDRYNPGVMYASMEFPELPTGAQRRLLENGVIFSGLFGLLRPDDLIPNYRLKMDARLPEAGKLSAFWKPMLSQALNDALKGKFVWDLLPGAHRDAWDDDGSYRALVQVKFYDENSGERKAVTHNVKQLRGALVNYIVRDPAESIEALLDWEAPGGFELDEDETTFDDETKTGTVVMVSRPGWEKRREQRRVRRAEEAAEKAAAKAAREAEDDEE